MLQPSGGFCPCFSSGKILKGPEEKKELEVQNLPWIELVLRKFDEALTS